MHRLDKDTAGCLVIAKTRFAAAQLATSFRSRAARKVYWAIVAGVPRTRQGRISTYLSKEEIGETDSRVGIEADLTSLRLDNILPGWVKVPGKSGKATFIDTTGRLDRFAKKFGGTYSFQKSGGAAAPAAAPAAAK